MEYNTSSVTMADPWQRLAAALIDALLVIVIHWICIILFGFMGGSSLGVLAGLAYSLLKDAVPVLKGKSIGKTLIGLRVVRVTDHTAITGDYATAIKRAVTLCIPFFNIVDALMVFSIERQRFGDRWADTIVIVSKD